MAKKTVKQLKAELLEAEQLEALAKAAEEAGMKDRLPVITERQLLLIELGDMVHKTWSAVNLFGGINSRQKQISELLNTGEALDLLRKISAS